MTCPVTATVPFGVAAVGVGVACEGFVPARRRAVGTCREELDGHRCDGHEHEDARDAFRGQGDVPAST